MEIGKTLVVDSRTGWRRWLAKHHADHREIWLVYNKKASGKGGISYDESVEEALCYGWIDGLTKRIDEMTYTTRFTPRRPGSNWSESNVIRIGHLLKKGRITKSGLAVIPPDLVKSARA
ncbi:MAG: hypothetical protein M3077_15230 [Candidatus Dormibacteraeota bacterium]|nr:hypothetical protein [Candidatus Dormibacteraeota bacterium]